MQNNVSRAMKEKVLKSRDNDGWSRPTRLSVMAVALVLLFNGLTLGADSSAAPRDCGGVKPTQPAADLNGSIVILNPMPQAPVVSDLNDGVNETFRISAAVQGATASRV